MKAIPMGFMIVVLGVASGPLQVNTSVAQEKPVGVRQWEYRVLTKDQVLGLGKKDLAAGLNKLGGEGWELAAVDTGYIFKRLKEQDRRQIEDVKSQIAFIELDVEAFKDKVNWSERMLKKGYYSEQQVQAERLLLRKAELALERARKELKSFSSDAKEAPEKERKPEK